MNKVLRVKRRGRRSRLARLPSRVLWGMWLALLETVLLLGLMIWGGVELWAGEREASFARPRRVLEGVSVDGESVQGVDNETLSALLQVRATEWLDTPIRLHTPQQDFFRTPRELGVISAVEPALDKALAVGREGDFWSRVTARLNARRYGAPIVADTRIDTKRVDEVVQELAKKAERAPQSGQMDLQQRKLRRATPAQGLLKIESRLAIIEGLAQHKREIALVPYELQLPDSADSHDVPSIATRLGEATTRCLTELSEDESQAFSRWIQRLDGQILDPGERWSFWERLKAKANSIPQQDAPNQGGCDVSQLASTIASAAFFAGLDLVQRHLYPQIPRFIEPGLESWVAPQDRDLVLQNPHPDPVVLHVSRRGTEIEVEFLGAMRPFKATFERHVQTQSDFAVHKRSDKELLLGSTKILEPGQLGYTGTIARILSWEQGEIKRENWPMEYPAKAQVLAVGTNPLGISAHADSANQRSGDHEDSSGDSPASSGLRMEVPTLDILVKKVQ